MSEQPAECEVCLVGVPHKPGTVRISLALVLTLPYSHVVLGGDDVGVVHVADRVSQYLITLITWCGGGGGGQVCR